MLHGRLGSGSSTDPEEPHEKAPAVALGAGGLSEAIRERRLRKLLEVALDLPTGERRAALEERTGDVELVAEALALLEGEAELEGFLGRPAADLLGAGGLEDHLDAAAPEIPGFTIGRSLGEGGMGRVYLARQTHPVSRDVAIKIVRTSPIDPETAQRFAIEQQALARLNHPAIAQLYTAAMTPEGQPYVIMEYVPGEPMTDFCDRERLSIEARLRLFISVCHGVEHAHRRQVLHRDLKPSNILVTCIDGAPAPKIIDFGISRALDTPTGGESGAARSMLFGTPHYMSPEALGPSEGPRDLDTRTDVYSLGVVLYELLTGARPFAAESGDVALLMRSIVESDPPRPSLRIEQTEVEQRQRIAGARGREPRRLTRRLGGDLDAIVLMALARDREQRYGSAAELADDLERSLGDLPVIARPPKFPERMVKRARRHRLAASLLAVTVVAVLAAGVLSAVALVRTTRAERQAQEEAQASREVLAFVVDLFEAASPETAQSTDLSARQLVALGAARIEKQDLPPLQRARLLQTLGDVQLRLGEYDSGRDLASEALAIREARLDPEHPDVLASLELLGNIERRSGNLDTAEPLVEHLVAAREKRKDQPLALADALNSLANLRWRQERFEDAEATHRRALAIRQEALDRGEPVEAEVAASLNNLGALLWSEHRLAEAEPYLREAEIGFEKVFGPEHPRVSIALGNLGIVLADLGRFEEAEALQRRALAIREKVLGPDHPDTAAALNNIALLLGRQGHLAEAEATYRRCLEIWSRALGVEHPETIKARGNLASILRREGRYDEAEALYRQILDTETRLLGESDPATARARVRLASVLREEGRLEEAGTLLRRGLGELRAALGDENRDVAEALFQLGALAYQQGDDEEAEAKVREALRIREAVRPDPKLLGGTLFELGGIVRHRGRGKEARAIYQRALELQKASLPAGHRDVRETEEALEKLGSGDRAMLSASPPKDE